MIGAIGIPAAGAAVASTQPLQHERCPPLRRRLEGSWNRATGADVAECLRQLGAVCATPWPGQAASKTAPDER